MNQAIIEQKHFFSTGKTLPLAYRRGVLEKLRRVLHDNRRLIIRALFEDLHKPSLEAYGSEIAIVESEIDLALRKMKQWARAEKHHPFLINRPARCYTYPHPYGSVLIVGPWNYPAGLILWPLVSALAAGNCAVLKPSEYAPATGCCLRTIINRSFDPACLTVVEGDAQTVRALIHDKPDYIFFTGGIAAGKSVQHEAADGTIPLSLELGGKNPCIIDEFFDTQVAARRIVWGKFFNAGQSCVAPDYCLVPQKRLGEFACSLIGAVTALFGLDPSQSRDYARIINTSHFDRLKRLLETGRIVLGGQSNRESLYIAPTIIADIDPNHPLMQEEIFGPLLPILPYATLDEAMAIANRCPDPLAIYCFSEDKWFRTRVGQAIRSGNICYNGTIHLTMARGLPFGGVGSSGMGRYHGKSGFDQFSYYRSVVEKSPHFEFPLVYPPYRLPRSMLSALRRVFF